MTDRNLALAALIAGVVVMGLSAAFLAMPMRTAQPLHGAYGDVLMLAFELAETPDQLAGVIGPNPPTPDAQAIRDTMDKANRLDFAYMAAYGVFIALSCALAARVSGRRWLLLGMVLGPAAALFDVAENLALLDLTQPGADWPALLASLHVRTFGKWELLALTSSLFASTFVGAGAAWKSVLAALVAALSALAGPLAYADPPRYGALLMNTDAVVWLWQLVFAGTVLFRRQS